MKLPRWPNPNGGIRRRSRRRSFAGDTTGATIVEFALLAPIFFSTLLTVFEVGIMFGTSVMLDTAAQNAGRVVRTGAIYEATWPGLDPTAQKDLFETEMCREMFLADCADLSYDVQASANFQSASADVTFDADGAIESPGFDIGAPREIVVVTVAHRYDFIIPFLANAWGQDGLNTPNSRVLRSTLVFRNEPFPVAY
jgi:Flp pilus assembly pilin Flp